MVEKNIAMGSVASLVMVARFFFFASRSFLMPGLPRAFSSAFFSTSVCSTSALASVGLCCCCLSAIRV
jgi:hypothetical protein